MAKIRNEVPSILAFKIPSELGGVFVLRGNSEETVSEAVLSQLRKNRGFARLEKTSWISVY